MKLYIVLHIFKVHTLIKYSNNKFIRLKRGVNVAIPLNNKLSEIIAKFKIDLGNSSDLVIRNFSIELEINIDAAIIYIDGFVDKDLIQTTLLDNILIYKKNIQVDNKLFDVEDLIKFFKYSVGSTEIKVIDSYKDAYSSLLSGLSIIVIDKNDKALALDCKDIKGRPVEEATTQNVIRGAKEAFNESLRINTILIRKRLKDSKLRIETTIVGSRTKTDVAILYLDDVVDKNVLNELKNRLNRVDTEKILEGSNVEELIGETQYSIFPTIDNTERPDTVVADLVEGRIALIVDGTPFALVLPATFNKFFQSAEDYNEKFDISSAIRTLRFLSFFIALLTPSILLALVTFHQEMIPTPLLINLVTQRQTVPFPALIEILLMEIVFEILREAAIRLPKNIGSTISIVGAIVLGQATIEAGLVSPILLITVAVTGIASYIAPSFNMSLSVRIIRFFFLFAASFMGLIGIFVLLIMFILHIASLRSFGVPYMSPLTPIRTKNLRDINLFQLSQSIFGKIKSLKTNTKRR